VFDSAIAVRDELATAFFGRLASGAPPPSSLSIRFYDSGGAETATLSNLDVQVSSSGLVFAAPSTALPKNRQQNIQRAVAAKVMTKSDVQKVYIGQAQGAISVFRGPDYRGSLTQSVDGGGCPHCLAYFICYCMQKTYQMSVNRDAFECSSVPDYQLPCEKIETLVPVPW
jgi:hypothetical protein